MRARLGGRSTIPAPRTNRINAACGWMHAAPIPRPFRPSLEIFKRLTGHAGDPLGTNLRVSRRDSVLGLIFHPFGCRSTRKDREFVPRIFSFPPATSISLPLSFSLFSILFFSVSPIPEYVSSGFLARPYDLLDPHWPSVPSTLRENAV
jgi:hypothetical protein